MCSSDLLSRSKAKETSVRDRSTISLAILSAANLISGPSGMVFLRYGWQRSIDSNIARNCLDCATISIEKLIKTQRLLLYLSIDGNGHELI